MRAPPASTSRPPAAAPTCCWSRTTASAWRPDELRAGGRAPRDLQAAGGERRGRSLAHRHHGLSRRGAAVDRRGGAADHRQPRDGRARRREIKVDGGGVEGPAPAGVSRQRPARHARRGARAVLRHPGAAEIPEVGALGRPGHRRHRQAPGHGAARYRLSPDPGRPPGAGPGGRGRSDGWPPAAGWRASWAASSATMPCGWTRRAKA